MTTQKIEIKLFNVYCNDIGESRLVVSTRPVVTWQTIDPELAPGIKAQGSATRSIFLSWAKTMRKATQNEINAFEAVKQRREMKARITKECNVVKRRMRKAN